MSRLQLLTILIQFLRDEGFIFAGHIDQLDDLMCGYCENKVAAIKYLRNNTYMERPMSMIHNPTVTPMCMRFIQQMPTIKIKLNLKDAKDMLDTVYASRTVY